MKTKPLETKNADERQIAYFYRHSKRDKIQEFALRVICGLISTSIVIGVIYLISHGGIDNWKNNEEEFRSNIGMLGCAAYILLSLTTSYAIKGDKGLHSIKFFFKD